MARPVILSVQCAGQSLVPGQDFQTLLLHQTLFDHHSLSLIVPFDRVEGAKAPLMQAAPLNFLGQPISVNIEPDKQFKYGETTGFDFKGVLTELGTGKESDLSNSLTMQGYGMCGHLAGRIQKRTFRQQTLQAIFEQVLADYPTNLLVRKLAPRHRSPIAYVVQYQESDFTFLSRLACEYGEWFYYDGTVLHLGSPPDAPAIEFVADGVHNNFHLGLELTATKVKFYEYNYQRHERFTASTQSQQVPGASKHPFVQLVMQKADKLFPHESRTRAEVPVQSQGELAEEAATFRAQRVADMVALQGSSDNPALQLGRVIRATGPGLGSAHLHTADFGTYRVVEVTHTIDAGGMYSNTFTALPHLLEVPPLNPNYIPPTGSQELAEVIDTQDPAHLGRVRVRFDWDVDQPQQAESDWLRVLTPYAGDGKGQLFTPEVGSQVLVAYEHNLAEQPLVLGNLFHANNKQKAKYTNEGNHLKGMQTAGGNKVVMSDKKGQQTILLSNSNNKGTAVEVGFKGDGSITIKSNGPVTVLSPTITLEAGEKGEIKLHAKNITLEAENELKANAATVTIVGSQSAEVSGQTLMLAAQTSAKLKAQTQLQLTGLNVEMSGQAITDIKAPLVKINS